MYVAIVGSRGFTDLERVKRFVVRLAEKYPTAVVVSGGARGVDAAAEEAARHHGLDVFSYRPFEVKGQGFGIRKVFISGPTERERTMWPLDVATDAYYPSFGRCAFARNTLIVEKADQVVAFWDGTSKGTAHDIAEARRLGKPVHVYTP